MSLFNLAALAGSGRPVRVGVSGSGNLGSMFLSQAPRIPGLRAAAVADWQRAFAPGGMRS